MILARAKSLGYCGSHGPENLAGCANSYQGFPPPPAQEGRGSGGYSELFLKMILQF